MNEKYIDKYLILPAEDGTRADTKLAVEYSDADVEQFLAQGYVLVSSDNFSKLIGNGDRPYSIAMDGTLYETPPYVPPIDELRARKLEEIDSWTKAAIVGGFTSSAGDELATFDSDETDQQNIQIMLAASKSADFETSEYQGIIPIRGIPNGEVAKKIYYLNAAAMQQLSDDLARHIGSCKLRGWALQEATAVAQSKEELDAIVWENS